MGSQGAPGVDIPILEVEDLVKRFAVGGTTVRAINGISFRVHPKETVALVGESGCGKTTAGRCIVRLLEPDAGNISFQGQDITRLSSRSIRPLRRQIQMVFQDPDGSLNPSFTVRRTLSEPMNLHRIASKSEVGDRLVELMRLVQLDPGLLGSRPHELSGGEKQRVCIARAIATHPAFLVLDEPTSSLDMSLRRTLLELLSSLQASLGTTYLFITHDFSTVRHLADRVIVMYLGKVVETGPVDEVLDNPGHPYTKALISAIPIPDPHLRRKRIMLEGETPSVLSVPSGCPFQSRCPYVMEDCRAHDIPFFPFGRSMVACLLYAAQSGPPDG